MGTQKGTIRCRHFGTRPEADQVANKHRARPSRSHRTFRVIEEGGEFVTLAALPKSRPPPTQKAGSRCLLRGSLPCR